MSDGKIITTTASKPEVAEPEGQVFHVSFHIEAWPEGLKAEEMVEGFAGCDSLLQVVMIHDKENGKKHYSVMSMDGEKSKPLSFREQWEAWYVLGRALSQQMNPHDPEDGWRQQICEGLVEVCQAARKDVRQKQDTGVVDAHGNRIRK